MMVGVNAKRTCRGRASHLCRVAQRRDGCSSAQSGHPEKKFAPRQRARIPAAYLAITDDFILEASHFICGFIESHSSLPHGAPGSLRFADHTDARMYLQPFAY